MIDDDVPVSSRKISDEKRPQDSMDKIADMGDADLFKDEGLIHDGAGWKDTRIDSRNMRKQNSRSRPAKRQRTSLGDDHSLNGVSSALVTGLLERLMTVKRSSAALRDEHLARAAEIDATVGSKQASRLAAELLVRPEPDETTKNLFRGFKLERKRRKHHSASKPAVPAITMLVKPDSLERSVMAQTIIAKAQAINRKNAELARERLPKQPEAGRNKTHWDYLLDEAVWMARDLREERKWKISLARKVSKLIVQYHNAKSLRAERALRAEEMRRVRVAHGIAREVRKFWSQVRELANYRLSKVEARKHRARRERQLKSLLRKTGEYTSVLASKLRSGSHSGVDSGVEAYSSESSELEEYKMDRKAISDAEEMLSSANEGDRTEAEELDDLGNEAIIPIADLLRSQGIDPVAYIEDDKDYGKRGEEDLRANPQELVTEPVIKNQDQTDTEMPDKEEESQEDADEMNTKATGLELAKSPEDVSTPEKKKEDSIESAVKQYMQQGEVGTSMKFPNDQDLLTVEPKPRQESKAVTLSSTHKELGAEQESSVRIPSELLRGTLRDYQRVGLQWLTAMYQKKLNGILADEMGLGKTIQAIALLAWLAVEKGIWGPHLIVVPTSVILNWEVEFKKFLPGFKVLTYFGSIKERKAKRVGWSKPNTFHVCVTSYTLVVQDATVLKRKKWVYLILDEAHNIKNFQSLRWQTLLNFPSYRRLLLTGTPLQNSVMELWSLMHFLMPTLFSSHAEFKDWFSAPLNDIVSKERSDKQDGGGHEVVSQLHAVLRPFLLRRLKSEVERSLPPKSEHIVRCPLSKRQRQLYEDFMARSETQNTIASGDFFGVMNVLMQLRKVCNHPDLFDGRPIHSPFQMSPIVYPVPSLLVDALQKDPLEYLDLPLLNLDLATMENNEWPGRWVTEEMGRLSAVSLIIEEARKVRAKVVGGSSASLATQDAARRVADFRRQVLAHMASVTELRLRQTGLYGGDVLAKCMINPARLMCSVKDMRQRAKEGSALLENFGHCIRKVNVGVLEMLYKGDSLKEAREKDWADQLRRATKEITNIWRRAEIQSQISLPDTRLIQWDCGKLQILANLLRELKKQGSRVLIFTQMSKVLDILETFLNLHAHRYLRLDGTTKTSERQKRVERFNQDPRVFCMILTTRSGGLGLNLVGADCVIFYDNDWNPAVDAQAQDRAHRIGQTKHVRIFRLVSSLTVEENILTKANQKRNLESLVISKAGFTTDGFRQKINVRELITPLTPERSSGSKIPFASLSHDPPLKSPVTPAYEAYQQHKQSGRNNVKEGEAVSQVVEKSADPGLNKTAAYMPALSATGVVSGKQAPQEPSNTTSMESITKGVSALDESALDGGKNADISLQAVMMDESERAGVLAVQREAELAKAEFDESQEVTFAADGGSGSGDAETGEENEYGVFRMMKPIELYALRLVEGSGEEETGPEVGYEEKGIEESLDREFALDRMLKRRMQEEEEKEKELYEVQVPTTNKLGLKSDEKCKQYETSLGKMKSRSSEGDLFYEIDCSKEGVASYLKALAAADAQVRVYVALRDGGPEELKTSTVVNGTPASGLECAEDAAFFPHAYNRMTRTAHATRRQQEKLLAKLAKRKAELAKRNAIAGAGLPPNSSSAAPTGLVPNVPGRGIVADDPSGVYMGQRGSIAASMNGFLPPLKRPRLDSRIASYGSSDNLSGSGLFKRSTKKATLRRALMAHSRGWSTADPTWEIGKNDNWTAEQDQALLAFAATYGNNMYVASDALRLHPGVAAGFRSRKTPQQCASRMFKVLTPKGSTSIPATKPPPSDLAVMRNHIKSIANAVHSIEKQREQQPPTYQLHPSHAKVEEASTHVGRSKFGPIPLQPAQSVSQWHRPGWKPHETSPNAVAKRKRPFLRPLRDSRRISGVPIGRPNMPLTDARSAGLGGLPRGLGLQHTGRTVSKFDNNSGLSATVRQSVGRKRVTPKKAPSPSLPAGIGEIAGPSQTPSKELSARPLVNTSGGISAASEAALHVAQRAATLVGGVPAPDQGSMMAAHAAASAAAVAQQAAKNAATISAKGAGQTRGQQ